MERACWPGKPFVSAVGVRDHPEVDTHEIQAAFEDVFDQAIVFHGFADYMRDYDVFARGRDLEGYVWGVKWQELYPGMKLVPKSAEAREWSRELGLPYHEAVIEANSQILSLVFSDLTVQTVDAGYAPFAVPDDGPPGS